MLIAKSSESGNEWLCESPGTGAIKSSPAKREANGDKTTNASLTSITLSLLSISLQTLAVYLGERFIGPEMNLADYTVPTRIAILFPTIIFIVIPLNYLIYNKLIWKTQYLKNKDYEYIEKSKQKKS